MFYQNTDMMWYSGSQSISVCCILDHFSVTFVLFASFHVVNVGLVTAVSCFTNYELRLKSVDKCSIF